MKTIDWSILSTMEEFFIKFDIEAGLNLIEEFEVANQSTQDFLDEQDTRCELMGAGQAVYDRLQNMIELCYYDELDAFCRMIIEYSNYMPIMPLVNKTIT